MISGSSGITGRAVIYAHVGGFSAQTEHIFHIIKARLLTHEPFGRLHRAIGKNTPIKSPMTESDLLCARSEKKRVLPHDLSPTQGREPDFAGFARATLAFSCRCSHIGDCPL